MLGRLVLLNAEAYCQVVVQDSGKSGTNWLAWPEPRVAFNRIVVTRYRIFLEQAHYASSTINLRLAAVRRLAYEAADSGLLSPDLAAGIRRVKGAKKHGTRVGNWLTAEQGRALLSMFDRTALRGKRDYAMVAVLLDAACGEPSWLLLKLQTYSNAKNTGYSPT
jgi:integrase